MLELPRLQQGYQPCLQELPMNETWEQTSSSVTNYYKLKWCLWRAAVHTSPHRRRDTKQRLYTAGRPFLSRAAPLH
ncbi:hypothetical protein E2C01_102478 [Portunus trituberculatus]|uniref:Uncharacterized protein n=1 Tax=Portunus trituberculatus TaxID=210409 RepID=A0A5B7KPA2_PORTR|nr:hypothetical protein [Portunus trituberculatus]